MAKVRGTSNAPIVLGAVGGGLGLPASLCSGMCAAAVEGMTEAEASGMIEFYLYGTAIISIALIILACFSKRFPVAVGILMLIATVIGGVLFVVTANFLGMVAMLLTLIGAILCLVQKKEAIE